MRNTACCAKRPEPAEGLTAHYNTVGGAFEPRFGRFPRFLRFLRFLRFQRIAYWTNRRLDESPNSLIK